ncbi:YggT family protein [Patescibacteria group bacterium]|nr:YggT family protein [Patescibacteria group bacterium]
MEIRYYLAQFVAIFSELIWLAILIRVIMSWIQPVKPTGGFTGIIFEVTEPILSFFRRIVPRLGMIDISPIVALLVINFISELLLKIIL